MLVENDTVPYERKNLATPYLIDYVLRKTKIVSMVRFLFFQYNDNISPRIVLFINVVSSKPTKNVSAAILNAYILHLSFWMPIKVRPPFSDAYPMSMLRNVYLYSTVGDACGFVAGVSFLKMSKVTVSTISSSSSQNNFLYSKSIYRIIMLI